MSMPRSAASDNYHFPLDQANQVYNYEYFFIHILFS